MLFAIYKHVHVPASSSSPTNSGLHSSHMNYSNYFTDNNNLVIQIQSGAFFDSLDKTKFCLCFNDIDGRDSITASLHIPITFCRVSNNKQRET